MLKRNMTSIFRYVVLAGILVFVSYQMFSHVLGNKMFPAVHGICPFGGLESLYFYVTGGATLGKIFSGTMGLFFITIILTLLFRRSFCGMICPLGTLQELFSLPGRMLFRKVPFVIPAVIDRPLRFFKYIFLIVIIAMTILTGTLWFQSFDPWTAYAHLLNINDLLGAYLIGFVILIVTLAGSFFFDRFFCKYACPMGAFNSIVGFFIPYKVKREKDLCTNCGLCSKECPVQIPVDQLETVSSAECINCDKCVYVCPAPGALTTRFWGIAIKPLVALILIASVYGLGILAFQFAGYDRYSGKAEPSLREMAKQQNITTVEFKKRYGLPAGFPDNAKLRKIEYSIPFYKMAELNGLTSGQMKINLGLPEKLDEKMKWGDAFGDVKLSVIAGMNNASTEEYIAYFKLGKKVTGDTKWKDVRSKVEAFLDKQNGESGGGCGSH